jgi:hypothetical protein
MGGWKTDNGGNITQLGGSYANNPSGVIVSAAANVGGIIVRTCALIASAGGNIRLLADTNAILAAVDGGTGNLQRDIYLPPGVELAVQVIAGSTAAYVSYDLL